MRKLFIAILVLLAIPPLFLGALVLSGTISTTSVRMMLNVMAGFEGPAASDELVQQRYLLPPGFSMSLYAADLPRARFLRFTEAGDLLVSRPHAGDIVLLQADKDGDGRADGVKTVVSGLKRALGLDIGPEGDLYVAESHRIVRYPFDATEGRVTGEPIVVVDGFTDDGNHWSKTLRFGPDGMLYLAQGSTCNVCEEPDDRRATMMRFAVDGSGGEIIATGLRNSVGFDWAPWNGALFATDNGRDLLGDDFPPCELNEIVEGGYYGWPYFNGDNLEDPDMGPDPLAAKRQPLMPAHGFRAHNAPLGMGFVDATGWPEEYRRSALVALHGSWNRSEPDGYKVVSLHWGEAGIEERDFLSGFNLDGDISGRPVDVLQGPDGAVYISDDYAGAIYRVEYTGGDGTVAMLPVASSRETKAPASWLAGADLDAMAERGAALYEANNCAECHESGENPARLDDLRERRSHDEVIEALMAPQSPMPVYPFSEQEQRDLAVFLLR